MKNHYRTFAPQTQMRGYGEEKAGKIQHIKIKVGEIEFDSLAEHDRYLELKAMERAGLIRDIVCHPSYVCLPPQQTPEGRQNFRQVVYTPDFKYTVAADGREVVEEVKSEYTRHEKDYVIRRKLLYYTQGIYVEELVR